MTTEESTQKSHGLIFTGALMPRIIDGSKTRTMRLITRANSLIDGGPAYERVWSELDWSTAWVDEGPSPAGNAGPYLHVARPSHGTVHRVYPRIRVGDTIWARETWQYAKSGTKNAVAFRAAGDTHDVPFAGWRSPLHLRRTDSRWTSPPLARVYPQRPQGLNEREALAEGIELKVCDQTIVCRNYAADGEWFQDWSEYDPGFTETPTIASFRSLWEAINGPKSWEQNPLCWVYDWTNRSNPTERTSR